MLTKEQIETTRIAADLIESGRFAFSCHALCYAEPEYEGLWTPLRVKYTEFYDFIGVTGDWGNLPGKGEHCTAETQLQRELMLELFAVTKGVL